MLPGKGSHLWRPRGQSIKADAEHEMGSKNMTDWGRVLTAMVTPFHPSGDINEGAIPQLVDHLFQTGSDGLVVCGTTGESPTLSHEEKLRMFKLVKQAARGRGPVIAGTGTNNTADSITLSKEAA